jgi:microcystin-dependent protein
MAEAYLGEIRLFGGNFAPDGWMLCDGALLNIVEYDVLYSLLGTQYGGDGRATFGLPNLTKKLSMGQGQGPGLSPRQCGDSVGSDSVALAGPTVGQHSHALRGSTNAAGSDDEPNNMVLGPGVASGANLALYYSQDAGTPVALASGSISSTGQGAAHENRMPAQCVLYIICVRGGIYPPRP